MGDLPTTLLFFLTHHVLSMLGFALALVLLSTLLRERRPPGSTVAWLLAIILAPYIGVPLYLLIGGRKLKRRAGRKARLYTPVMPLTDTHGGRAIESILRSAGLPGPSEGNRIELLESGEAAFAALLQAVDEAKRSIHIATFILGNDEAGIPLVERLERRAREGLEVRLLIDGLFSFRPSAARLAGLRRAGAGVAVFMPIWHLPLLGSANLRNHRKIVVIDGQSAIVGGMNIAGEYMGPTPRADRWRDLAARVSGPAVADIATIFRSDWAFAAGERLERQSREGREGSIEDAARGGGATAQVVASGPDVPGDTFYDAILTGLFGARERIWIATPYFIPDESLARALVLAARRGVDVRIAVPVPSNHWTADVAGGSYLRQVQEAGARVHPYRRGMLHAKATLIDGAMGVVGSANMDIRSLFLDYEIAVFAYSPPDVERLAVWFRDLFALCEERLPEAGRGRGAAEAIGRLLAPLV